ncbi:hypothetical protein ACP4OV_016699 [Aristida adscensionis]
MATKRLATKRRLRHPTSDDAEEEERAQPEKKGEEESGNVSPVTNVVADAVAASPRPTKGKPSGEVAASPRPKKTAATSSALAPEEEQQQMEEEEEPGEAAPGNNAQADGTAASSPERSKRTRPSGEVAAPAKPKKTAATSFAPAPAPAREEEEEQQMEEDKEPGEAAPGNNAPADGTAASSPERNKRTKPSGEVAASPRAKKMAAAAAPSPRPKRGAKSPPPQEERERAKHEGHGLGEEGAPAGEAAAPPPRKRSKASGEVAVEVHQTVQALPLPEMGAPADGNAVSPPVPKKRSKHSRGKNPASPQRKKKKKKKKKVEPSAKSQLESMVEEVVVQEEEEEEEEAVVVEQVPAQNTALGNVGGTKEEQVDQSSEAVPLVVALSAKPRNSQQENKPGYQRSWSKEDELRILRALVEHAQNHDGERPEPSELFATLAASFDRKDADAGRFANKIKKLKLWHGKMRLQGRPIDDHGSQLYDLCDKVWGSGNGALKNTGHGNTVVLRRSPRNINDKGDVARPQMAHQEVNAGASHASLGKRESSRGRVAKDKQVKMTIVKREFDELSKLYPYLAKEVEGYAEKHSSVDGKLIMEAFEAIGDDEASNLDASFKKQRIDMFNLEVKLVSTLSDLMN